MICLPRYLEIASALIGFHCSLNNREILQGTKNDKMFA